MTEQPVVEEKCIEPTPEIKDSTEELHYNEEKLSETDFPPASEQPLMLTARLITVRAPRSTEEHAIQSEFELWNKGGPKGTLVLPYHADMGQIGSTFFMQLRLHKMSYEDYLLNRPERITYPVQSKEGVGVV